MHLNNTLAVLNVEITAPKEAFLFKVSAKNAQLFETPLVLYYLLDKQPKRFVTLAAGHVLQTHFPITGKQIQYKLVFTMLHVNHKSLASLNRLEKHETLTWYNGNPS